MRLTLATVTLITLLIAAFNVPRLDDASLWYDEAWSVYAVSAPPPSTYEPPRGLRAILRTAAYGARDDALTTLQRVHEDVHPPLYFLTLDGWTWLTGESVFALRYLSLLTGLIGMATVAALGRRLSDTTGGITAALVFGTSLLWTYYAREARMYAPLMMLAAASTLAYLSLIERPNWRWVALYAVIVALGVYTHYTAALVPLAHGIHLVFSSRQHNRVGTQHAVSLRALWIWLAAMIGTVVLYVPWLPSLYAQFTTNPGGPLATPEPTSWAAVRTLTGYFAGRGLPLYLALIVIAVVWRWRSRTRRDVPGLLLAWLLIVPAAVFAANAWLLPVYNPRYTLAALPALALLAGDGLAAMWRWGRLWRAVALVALAVLAFDGLTAYDGGWGAKPPYREVTVAAAEIRSLTEPAITRLVPYDPFDYHAQEADLLTANTVNLAW
ncbi:MAG: glycosyltransferase family 39 protein, partial [Chloroflexota bacterium]